jgi:cardiolipin synthase
MEEMYLDDLKHSTEIILSKRYKVRPIEKMPRRSLSQRGFGSGNVSRVGAGALSIGSAVGAAITNHRLLGPAEARVMIVAGILGLAFTIAFLLWPRWVTIPLGIFSGWLAISFFIKAYKLRRKKREEDNSV